MVQQELPSSNKEPLSRYQHGPAQVSLSVSEGHKIRGFVENWTSK